MEEIKALTVRQLMSLLSGVNPDAVVRLEGCDCEEDCVGYSLEDLGEEGIAVLLRREYGVERDVPIIS